MKVCSRCVQSKPLGDYHRQAASRDGRKPACKECTREAYLSNRYELIDRALDRYYENRETLKQYAKSRRERPGARAERNRKARERRRVDPSFGFMLSVNNSVRRALKHDGKRRGGKILDNMPFTVEELIEHTSKWPSGWRLGHVIPQHDLKFDYFEHPNFLECWALDNLCPVYD